MKSVQRNDYLKFSELREYLVVKSNDLIQKSRFALTLQEQRIVLYLISKIKPDDDALEWQEFEVIEFCKVCGIDCANGKNYKNIKDTILTLAEKSAWIMVEDKQGEEEQIIVRWISKARISPKSGRIKIKLDDDMKPYLLQLRKRFTQYRLYYTLAMRSQYSIRLYELLKSYEWQSGKIFGIDELKTILNAAHYTQYGDFRRNVISIAIDEINLLSDIKVVYALIKEGRRYSKIEFKVQLKKDMDERLSTFVNIESIISGKQEAN